jgi:ubiquinone/menaquinone biosynthesis C-methylase UbiE
MAGDDCAAPAVTVAPSETPVALDVPVLRGPLPGESERAYVEYQNYESGQAEREACCARAPDTVAAWRAVHAEYGKYADRVLDFALAHPDLGPRVRGTVADIAAGSCWLAGRVGSLLRVERVYAQDLSEGFLKRVGVPMYAASGGELRKLTLVASDFNHLPLPDDELDAAFIFAALHHSLSPIPTLREVFRCLKPQAPLIIYEVPTPLLRLEAHRRASVQFQTTSEIPMTYWDIRFCLTMAGATSIREYPLDFSRSPVRRLLRQALRRSRLENYVRPPGYLFVAAAG